MGKNETKPVEAPTVPPVNLDTLEAMVLKLPWDPDQLRAALGEIVRALKERR